MCYSALTVVIKLPKGQKITTRCHLLVGNIVVWSPKRSAKVIRMCPILKVPYTSENILRTKHF